MMVKAFLIRAGVTAAAGTLATVGFAASASASETDGWSWQRADVASVGTADVQPDGWSWQEVEPDGWSWQ